MLPILQSKKFQASLVGLVVAVLSHLGFDLDPGDLLAILSPILAYIGGQAVADAGKEKQREVRMQNESQNKE